MRHTQQHPSEHAINFAQKASLIEQQWSPRVIAEMNEYQSKSNAWKAPGGLVLSTWQVLSESLWYLLCLWCL